MASTWTVVARSATSPASAFWAMPTPATCSGKNMHRLIHHTRADGTPYPPEACRILQAFRKGEGAHVEDEVMWRADGTSFPVEYWSYPMRRGEQVVGAVVTFVDITERRRAEEAQHEGKERLRLALDAGRMGIWDWNILTDEVTWTRRMEEIQGIDPGAFEGTYAAFLDGIHPEDREGVAQAVARRRCQRDRSPHRIPDRSA